MAPKTEGFRDMLISLISYKELFSFISPEGTVRRYLEMFALLFRKAVGYHGDAEGLFSRLKKAGADWSLMN